MDLGRVGGRIDGVSITLKSPEENTVNPEENLLNWTILAGRVAAFGWLHHDMTSVLNVIKRWFRSRRT